MPRILIRGDSASDWSAANPILALREPALETDTGKLKIGDGVTAWNSLAYWDPGTSRVLADGTWKVELKGDASTGLFTVEAIGPGPVTKTFTFNPSTGVVTSDGKALATQEWVLALLANALVVEPAILT